MPLWIIEPRDPLIVRDGRPFNADPGARSVSLPFPFPSTTAGAVRTRAGQDADGVFTARPDDMLRIAVRGPLLVELDAEGNVSCWLAPAPVDAILYDADDSHGEGHGETRWLRRRLAPLRPPAGSITNLPDDLGPVGLVRSDPRKPATNSPRFWRWSAFERWLAEPPAPEEYDWMAPSALGHDGPVREQRVHVGIDHATGAADEGALFSTSGLEFTRLAARDSLDSARRLALVVDADLPADGEQRAVLSPFGGERRLAAWRPAHLSLPACPDRVRDQVATQGHCRVLLLTPAHFRAGFRPDWLLQPRHGVTPRLLAVACGRPQVVSGWDVDKKQPKPTRRLAPAGSVYFLRLEGDAAAVAAWVDTHWLASVSDDPEQDRRDGFGLAAIGAWDGVPRVMAMAVDGDAGQSAGAGR